MALSQPIDAYDADADGDGSDAINSVDRPLEQFTFDALIAAWDTLQYPS